MKRIFAIPIVATVMSACIAGGSAAYATTNEADNAPDFDVSTLSILPEFNQPSIVSSGSCGTTMTWTRYSNGLLHITGTGAMEDYTRTRWNQGPKWGSLGITRVVVDEGVESISSEAFYGMSDIQSISLPSTLKSLGSFTFLGCSSLKSLSLPEGATCTVWLGDCSNFESVSIPSTVESVSISGASSLYNLNLSEGVKSISISGAPLLTELFLPEGLSSLRFTSCALDEINIPSTAIEVHIEMCPNVKELSIPDGVTSFDQGAFRGCTSLQSIDLPNSLTSMGAACFFGCSSLESIELPDSLATIRFGAFYGCTSLATVKLPSNLSIIEGAEVSGSGVWYGPTGQAVKPGAFENCTSLASVILPSSLSYIGDRTFSNCTSLSNITIPQSVTHIGNGAMYGCTNLKTVLMESSILANEIGTDAFNEIGYSSTIYANSQQQYESLYGVTRIYSPTRTNLAFFGAKPDDAVEAFAVRLYEDILGRTTDPRIDDPLGYSTQVNALRSGWQPAEIAYNYFNSAEYLNKHESSEQTIRRVYLVMFGREADAAGLAYWMNYLDSGMSIRSVVQGFSQSDEYHKYYRSIGINDSTISPSTLAPRDRNLGVTMFVYRLYVEALGRTPEAVRADSAGLDVQANAILNGMPAGQIAQNVFGSEEFAARNLSAADKVRTAYRVMLNRNAEVDELPYWVDRLNNGESIRSVIYGFSQSQEFSELCATYGVNPR